ncbi:hypothetical protein AMJ48_01980 [Parcubacteria bacterium DG_74_1]|nr:MAG: hypothetical protein AMJ48_01980 [Parcubacteria bacterium DG_74_1]
MKKKFYITTSIAYTNAPPHIGFALELVQADILARYHRILGEDVFFLTGTDEHGQKVVKAAEDAKKSPQEFVDVLSSRFKKLVEVLNLSNDGFIRTTDKKRHWPTVQKIWSKLEEGGDIYIKKYKGFYCFGCEAFIREKDLANGECPVHQTRPELIEEKNYFFRLSRYAKQVKEEIEANKIKVVPGARKNEILSFIEQGIEDISFSRPRKKVQWGIPVLSYIPKVGGIKSTTYVWVDALVNYISGLGGLSFISGVKNKYWPPDVQCIGKDILKFHALIWPAILIAAGLERPKNILVHGFITSGGQKMSKSLGNVIDPFELVKKYGTDAVRYFLLREIPPTEDGDFTYEKFKQRYNADLANGIGNLLARTLTMAEKYWLGIVPKIPQNTPETLSLGKFVTSGWVGNFQESIKEELIKSISSTENFSFNNSLFSVITSVFICDGYIEHHKLYKPAEKLGNKKEKIDAVLYNVLEGIRHIAWILLPFLPETANKIFEQLGLDPEKEKEKTFDETTKWGGLKPGTKFKKSKPLFPKI